MASHLHIAESKEPPVSHRCRASIRAQPLRRTATRDELGEFREIGFILADRRYRDAKESE